MAFMRVSHAIRLFAENASEQVKCRRYEWRTLNENIIAYFNQYDKWVTSKPRGLCQFRCFFFAISSVCVILQIGQNPRETDYKQKIVFEPKSHCHPSSVYVIFFPTLSGESNAKAESGARLSSSCSLGWNQSNLAQTNFLPVPGDLRARVCKSFPQESRARANTLLRMRRK